jgi:hypothetical protein
MLRMVPADFEFLINLIVFHIAKNDTTYRAAPPVEERLAVTLRFFFWLGAIRTTVCNTFSEFRKKQ